MNRKRVVLLAGAAGAAAAATVVLAPSIGAVRRSFATSSSPGARCYDLLAGRLLGGYYDDVAGDMASTLADEDLRTPRILEIGPGPGHVAARVLAMLRGAHWTGLDIDPAMLEASRARLERLGVADRAAFVEADVASMPFDDGAFDLAVTSFSAHHWPDPDAGFSEIRRVLRPGGVALVYDLPESWARLERGSAGIAVATTSPGAARTTVRGIGPWAIVQRVRFATPRAEADSVPT